MKKILLPLLSLFPTLSWADYLDLQHPQCQESFERCVEYYGPANVNFCMRNKPEPIGVDCYVEGDRPAYHFTAYVDEDKMGRQAAFPLGLTNMSKYDFDNKLSSYTLNSGYSATLFSGENGNGVAWFIESGSNPYVGKELNDQVSSVKVEKSSEVRPMMIYLDRDYEATRWDLKVGANNLIPIGAGDLMSSYKLRDGYVAYLYEHPDLQGEYITAYPGSNPWLGNKWNDRISSINVVKIN